MINFIKKIILILILTLINLYAYIDYLTRNTLLEDKIYCDVSIYDEFADDRVMVVLSKNASYNRKSYSYDDFNKYECSSVTEFTQSSSCFKNKDSKEHNRVFCLELTAKSKQNVLDVMEDLMKREDVVYAGPDFKINVLSTTPGDFYWENQSESMDIG